MGGNPFASDSASGLHWLLFPSLTLNPGSPASPRAGWSPRANTSLRAGATGTGRSTTSGTSNGLDQADATNASLVSTNVQRAVAGQYFAVVTQRIRRSDEPGRAIGRLCPDWHFRHRRPGEFEKILSTNAVLTRMATLNSWIEGVVWIPSDGGYLVFSDVGNNRLKKLMPPGTLTDFLKPPTNTSLQRQSSGPP